MSEGPKSSAILRLENLLDEDSFVELGSLVTARVTDFNLDPKTAPSDGVVTGYGLIDERLVFVYCQDSSVLNGTIGEMHAKKILNVYEKAMKMGAPVIGLIDCGGVRLQEGFDATEAIGEVIAKAVEASGVIPQIVGIMGNCGGSLSVLPALADFAFMEEKAKLFVNSPDAILGNCAEKNDTSSAAFQLEAGNVDAIGKEEEVFDKIRQMVSILPSSSLDGIFAEECIDDLNRASVGLEDKRNKVAEFAAEISDSHIFVETKTGWAKNMVTGLIKLNGMTVGAVANCSEVYDAEGNKAETFDMSLTAQGCNKAAEFIQFCDAFSIPVLSVTNVNGFKNCMCSEKKLAKALARMTYAFSNATCAKVNMITGEAYGSAYVFMNSKSIGADLVYAWNDAKIGTMDPTMAAKIMYPDADAAEIKEKASEYEKLQSSATSAAARGYVDRIIEPADSRKYLVAAFEMLYTKYVGEPEKKHGTK